MDSPVLLFALAIAAIVAVPQCKADYETVTSGTNCQRIQSKAECEAAAKELNLGDSGVSLNAEEEYKNWLPPYCFYMPGWQLYYNKNGQSHQQCDSNDNICICRKRDQEPVDTTTTNQCITNGGQQPGKACMFPWKNQGQPEVYYGCANPDGSDGPWCPTELSADGSYVRGSGKWGYCDMANWECSGTSVSGTFGTAYVNGQCQEYSLALTEQMCTTPATTTTPLGPAEDKYCLNNGNGSPHAWICYVDWESCTNTEYDNDEYDPSPWEYKDCFYNIVLMHIPEPKEQPEPNHQFKPEYCDLLDGWFTRAKEHCLMAERAYDQWYDYEFYQYFW